MRYLQIMPIMALALTSELSFADNVEINEKSHVSIETISVIPKTIPVAKGCTRFYFNQNGSCEQWESQIHFDALKLSSAIVKYNRWSIANKLKSK